MIPARRNLKGVSDNEEIPQKMDRLSDHWNISVLAVVLYGCIQIFQGPHRRILQLAGGVKLNKPNFAAV